MGKQDGNNDGWIAQLKRYWFPLVIFIGGILVGYVRLCGTVEAQSKTIRELQIGGTDLARKNEKDIVRIETKLDRLPVIEQKLDKVIQQTQ